MKYLMMVIVSIILVCLAPLASASEIVDVSQVMNYIDRTFPIVERMVVDNKEFVMLVIIAYLIFTRRKPS